MITTSGLGYAHKPSQNAFISHPSYTCNITQRNNLKHQVIKSTSYTMCLVGN